MLPPKRELNVNKNRQQVDDKVPWQIVFALPLHSSGDFHTRAHRRAYHSAGAALVLKAGDVPATNASVLHARGFLATGLLPWALMGLERLHVQFFVLLPPPLFPFSRAWTLGRFRVDRNTTTTSLSTPLAPPALPTKQQKQTNVNARTDASTRQTQAPAEGDLRGAQRRGAQAPGVRGPVDDAGRQGSVQGPAAGEGGPSADHRRGGGPRRSEGEQVIRAGRGEKVPGDSGAQGARGGARRAGAGRERTGGEARAGQVRRDGKFFALCRRHLEKKVDCASCQMFVFEQGSRVPALRASCVLAPLFFSLSNTHWFYPCSFSRVFEIAGIYVFYVFMYLYTSSVP